jgi:integrase/recombinase XerD
MQRLPASVLVPADVRLMLEHVQHQRYPERNRVMILLSFKAGLRACEVSGLEWNMVLGSDGKVSNQIIVAREIAKGRSGRLLPMHCDLQRSLKILHQKEGRPRTGHVIRSERGDGFTPASVVNWFGRLYGQLGLVGCSSHSGRRTFITTSARVLAKTGGSLRDIQELAGHRSLTTTERYIEGDRAAQRRLIDLL